MRIVEIFESIHGECNGHHQGRLVTFVRVAGCNLKCNWGNGVICDTPDTQDASNGKEVTEDYVINRVRSIGNKYVCITGGEPLMNKSIEILLSRLWAHGYNISVETNGSYDITPYFRYVDSFVIDYKGPSTGYQNKMILRNHLRLRPSDVIKFTIANEEDLYNAIRIKNKAEFSGTKCIFAFSPIEKLMSIQELLTLLKIRKVSDAVLSVQLHKIIGVQ